MNKYINTLIFIGHFVKDGNVNREQIKNIIDHFNPEYAEANRELVKDIKDIKTKLILCRLFGYELVYYFVDHSDNEELENMKNWEFENISDYIDDFNFDIFGKISNDEDIDGLRHFSSDDVADTIAESID